MADDLGTLSATITADAGPYQRALNDAIKYSQMLGGEVSRMAEAANSAMGALTNLGGATVRAMEESAQRTVSFAREFHHLQRLGRLAAEGIGFFIDKANEMDPVGAIAYHEALDRMRDSVFTLAGTLWKELRPAMEWVFTAVTDAMHLFGRFDFSKFGHDIKYAFQEVRYSIDDAWTSLKGFGDKLISWADTIGQLLVSPFQAMQDAILKATIWGFEKVGQAADIAAKVGIGSGGDRFRTAAQAAQTAGSPQIWDQMKEKMAGLGDAMKSLGGEAIDGLTKQVKDLMANGIPTYMKPTASADHHFLSKEQEEAWKGLNEFGAKSHQKGVDAIGNIQNEHITTGYNPFAGSAANDLGGYGAGLSAPDLGPIAAYLGAAGKLSRPDLERQMGPAAGLSLGGDQLKTGGLVDNFASSMTRAADANEKVRTVLGTLSAVFYDLRTGALSLSHAFAESAVAAGGEMMQKVSGKLDSLIKGAQSGAEGGGPAGILVGIGEALLQQSQQFQDIGKTLDAVIQSFANAVGAVLAPVQAIVSAAQDSGPMLALLGTAITGLLSPITESIQALGIMGPLSQALAVALSGTDPLVPIFNKIGQEVGYLGQQLDRAVKVFDPTAQLVAKLCVELTQVLGPEFGKLGNEFVQIAGIFNTAFLPYLQLLATGIAKVLPVLNGPLNQALEGLFYDVKDASIAVLTVAHFLGAAWDVALQVLGEAFVTAATGIANVIDFISNGWDAALEVLGQAFVASANGIADVVDFISSAWAQSLTMFSQALAGVANFFTATLPYAFDILLADMVGGLGAVLDKVDSMLNSIGLGKPAQALVNTLGSSYNDLIIAASKAAQNTTSGPDLSKDLSGLAFGTDGLRQAIDGAAAGLSSLKTDTSGLRGQIGDASKGLNSLAVPLGPLQAAIAAVTKLTWGQADAAQYNTQSLQALNQQLTNVPQAFSVAQALNQAMAGLGSATTGGGVANTYNGTDLQGGPSGLGGHSLGGGTATHFADRHSRDSGGQTFTGDIYIQVDGSNLDADELATAIQKKLTQRTALRGYGLNPLPVNRNAWKP